jgi:bifunctional non-homologous end joining protein LigD
MNSTTTRIDGKELKLSNLDKILYPSGFNKAEVIDYYRQIAPVMLPHLHDRPITLKRYPNGTRGMYFYQKRAPEHRPAWLKTAPIKTKSDVIDFCIIENAAGLVWLANLACLEIHAYLFKAQNPLVPTMMVFDLDPGAPATLNDCCAVAVSLQELLQQHGLSCLAKVSGSKGLHICVPLNYHETFTRTKLFAHAIARILEQRYPQKITSVMSKSERNGKVFIDWSQNDAAKTTCCVYSLRAVNAPMVSAPISWAEIRRVVKSSVTDSLIIQATDLLNSNKIASDEFAALESQVQYLPESSLDLNQTSSQVQGPRRTVSGQATSGNKKGRSHQVKL